MHRFEAGLYCTPTVYRYLQSINQLHIAAVLSLIDLKSLF